MSQDLESQTSESAHNAQERRKSNLAFAFFCMDADRAKDMETFYAFCRLMDDIADEETRPVEERRRQLLLWKEEIKKLYEGREDLTALAKEMREMIARRNIPQEYIQDIIDGVLTDTEAVKFQTYEQVRKYCYGVASAVGLASIYIFGFKNPQTKLFAEALGYALQFTNILRDVVGDAICHSRVYIPADEMASLGVSEGDLRNPSSNPNCKKLFQLMYFRAKHFFNKARRLIAEEDRRALAPAFIMWAIYEKILERIRESGFNITEKPVKISKPEKIWLAMKALRYSKRPSRQRKSFGKVAVVGAGIAGMTSALKLLLDGYDVDVFEARGSRGGRVATISAFGARLDNATHAAMGCYDNLRASMALCGADMNDIFSPVSGMDFISADSASTTVKYPKGNLFAKALSVLSYAKIKGFASARNMALLLEIKAAMMPREGETAAELLRRKKIPEQTVRSFWLPFCVSALNTKPEEADARLMADTLRKSLLKGREAGLLYLAKRPIADAYEHFEVYVKACGGSVNFGDSLSHIAFDGTRAAEITTSKSGAHSFDYLLLALPAKATARLLPKNSPIAEKLGSVRTTDIANAYFTTDKKLIASEYACIVGSPIHWLFDLTGRLGASAQKRLYSITISDAEIGGAGWEISKDFIERELGKVFGKFEILQVLPSLFRQATISADSKTQSARPRQSEIIGAFENVNAVGDWLQTDLPCTMESAAKSALEVTFDRYEDTCRISQHV